MRKSILTLTAAALLTASAASCCAASETVSPQHWTYHSLQILAEKKLISADIVPGMTLLTPKEVAQMVMESVRSAKNNIKLLGEDELISIRQLSNAYSDAIEDCGGNFAELRTETEECAARANLAVTEPNGKHGVKETFVSEKATASINKFTFDIYKALANKKGNLFLSPYSISSALSMTYAGARGTTEAEMAKVIGLDRSIHKNMGALIKEINSVPNDIAKISTANAFWPAKEENLLPQFTATVKDAYGAKCTQLDYKSNPDAAAAVINRWVAAHTEDKIRDIIAKGVLTKDTLLTLTNAVYFKSRWAEEFEPANTKAELFRTTPRDSVKIPMMTRTGDRIKYARSAWGEIAELPYTHGRFSMLVMLPNPGHGFAVSESVLSSKVIAELTSKMTAKKVTVTLPKFKAEQSFDLSRTLSGMGMPSAFGKGADFSGINGKRNMFIGGVIHKTFINVAEEGTEAAAATAVILSRMSMPTQEPPIIFRADRPFIYLIRDNKTGLILFIGRYTTPAK